MEGGRDETTSPGVELLEHIRDAFGAVWTGTLIERLVERDESPWKDIRGKPLDDRGLAWEFQIRSCDVKLNGTNRKGYRAEQFTDIWRRYVAPVGVSATSATNATSQNKKVAQIALVALCAHYGGNGELTQVGVGGGAFARVHDDCIDAWITAQTR